MDSCADKVVPLRPETSRATELRYKIEQGARTLDPFAIRHHMEILWANEAGAEGIMRVTPEVLNPYGTVHGGCLVALADTVAGHNMVAGGRLCVTQSSTVNFLRPATGQFVHCYAKPQKLGKSICVVSVDQTDEHDNLLTTALFTFSVMEQIEPHVIGKRGSSPYRSGERT
ncbi:MAG: PaaI family thioesterase [Evtepia sp.]